MTDASQRTPISLVYEKDQREQYRHIVKTLRTIADKLESGDYGEFPSRACLVLGFDAPAATAIHGMGAGQVADYHMLLSAGLRDLLRMTYPESDT